MTEIFRQREAHQTQETAPQAKQSIELISDTLKGGETGVEAPIEAEERKLEIWEGLKNKRFVDEYFDTHNTSSEFSVKMPTSEIDKFVRTELERRGYEKTTENYKRILQEIESEIGSEGLDLFKRFSKLTGYIRAINKFNKAKELKDKYRIE